MAGGRYALFLQSLVALCFALDVVLADWPRLEASIQYGGCKNPAWAVCMCVGPTCHSCMTHVRHMSTYSVGDFSQMNASIVGGELVYTFGTTLNLNAYGGRVPFDGESCEGLNFISIVTHKCDMQAGWSDVLQYDVDRCRMVINAEREGPCRWWRSAMYGAQDSAFTTGNATQLAALPSDPYHRSAVLHRNIIRHIASTGMSRVPLPIDDRANDRVIALETLEKKRIKRAKGNMTLVALHVTADNVANAKSIVKVFNEKKTSIILFVSDDTAVYDYKVGTSTFESRQWLKNVVVIKLQGRTRWWAAREILQETVVKGFGQVLVWSGEVNARDLSASTFLFTARRFSLDMFQPSVSHGCPCYIGNMLQRWGSDVRYTDIVELSAASFSTSAWLCFRNLLLPDVGLHGYGLEYVARSACQYHRIGVVDAAAVRIDCAASVTESERDAMTRDAQELTRVRYSNFAQSGWDLFGQEIPSTYATRPTPLAALQSTLTTESRQPSVHAVAASFSLWKSKGITRRMVEASAKVIQSWDPCQTKENIDMTRQGLRCIDIRGGFRITYVDNKMHLQLLAPSYQSRATNVEHWFLAAVDYAISIGDPIPSFEVVVNTGDHSLVPIKKVSKLSPIFSFATTSKHADVASPCFSYWNWQEADIGGWSHQRKRMLDAAANWPWTDRVDRVFWRGSDNGKFVTPSGQVTGKRRPLIELAKAHPNLIDAKFTVSKAPLLHVTLEDHCRYKFLINIAGATYSARLKYLLLCGSTVFHVADDNTEWFQAALQPMQHYIPVRRDMSDLVSQIEWARQHPKKAQEIAEQGQIFAREQLRTVDVLEALGNNLRKYANLQQFQPTVAPESTVADTHAAIDALASAHRE